MVAKKLPLSIDSPLKAVIYIKTAVEIVFKKGEHHKLANYILFKKIIANAWLDCTDSELTYIWLVSYWY